MNDYLYISNDGLVKSDNYNFIEVFNKNKEFSEKKKEEWILHLRKIGIKGIHPDDGWVDRENNTVIFENPYYEHFLIEEGDLICLGNYWESYRIVRVTKAFYCNKTIGFLNCDKYKFEPWFIKRKRTKYQNFKLILKYFWRNFKIGIKTYKIIGSMIFFLFLN